MYAGEGLDEFHAVRLHPNGPRTPQPTVDVRTGQAGYEQLSDFERKGWEVIWSDKIIEANPGVRDVSLDFYFGVFGGLSVVKSVGKGAMEAAGASTLDENAFVLRNGIPSADRFIKGAETIDETTGVLNGVSVKSAPGKSILELAEGGHPSAITKNGQIGVTTVREITNAGGKLVPDNPMNPNNPFHCVICGLNGSELEMIFKQQPNPLKKP